MENSSEISENDCKTVLKNYLKNEPFELISFMETSLQGKVFGSMGGFFKLHIVATIKGETMTKNFFVKTMKADRIIQNEVIKQQEAYKKEAFMYETFFEMLKTLENYKMDYVPKCYLKKEDDFLVFEDLNEAGFKVNFSENFIVDIDHCKVGLELLGKFHAGTILYEHKKSITNNKKYSLMDDYSEMFKEPLFRQEEDYLGNRLYVSSYKAVLDLIEVTTLDCDKAKLKEIYQQSVVNLYELVKPAKNQLNVVCHGDVWSPNILYRYNNDHPIDSKLIDFQATRYTVPAHDVLYFIHQMEMKELKSNFDMLLRYYHKSLESNLKLSGLDIKDYMTFEQFKTSCDYVLPMILVQQSVFVLMLLLGTHPELHSDQELYTTFMYEEPLKSKMCIDEYKKNKYFENLMNDIFKEFYNLKTESA